VEDDSILDERFLEEMVTRIFFNVTKTRKMEGEIRKFGCWAYCVDIVDVETGR
jgi:hypothetical protein